jgi:hypothetical protein
LEDLGIDGENIKMDLKEMGWGVCAGLMWFRVVTGGRDHLEDLGIDGENIKMDLKEMGWGVCAGLMWFRVVTGGRIL